MVHINSIYHLNAQVIEEQKHRHEEHEKSINAIKQNFEAQVVVLQEEHAIKLEEGMSRSISVNKIIHFHFREKQFSSETAGGKRKTS